MFLCNDGVVSVVDFYIHMEQVAFELIRLEKVADTLLPAASEPERVRGLCMSMSPSTCYLAVGGADGQVAVYDTTRDWAEVQLLDFSSHNEARDAGAPERVKITAMSWSANSTFLILGDNRGNVFLVTTVGRVEINRSDASSSGRSSAIVELKLQLPSDEPAEKPAWRVVKAVLNRQFTYTGRQPARRSRATGDLKDKNELNKKSSSKDKEKDRSKSKSILKSRGKDQHLPGESSGADGVPTCLSDSDHSEDDDGYNELRRDPREAITCLSWSEDMTYFVAGRKNHEVTVYKHSPDTFG